MKMLFITEYFHSFMQGAYQGAHAHYDSFCQLLGKEHVDVVSLKTTENRPKSVEMNMMYLEGYHNKWDKLINVLHRQTMFVSMAIVNKILRLVENNSYDFIYFDNSYFGQIIKEIKRRNPDLPVLVFYHGVQYNYGSQILKQHPFHLSTWLNACTNIHNERLTVAYADCQILLNERDSAELCKHYRKRADAFLPVCYRDTAQIKEAPQDEEFRILFVGGYFWPNVLGITWFAENVMPYLDKRAELYIVGRGMEVLREKSEFQGKDNIAIVGGTDDLDYWYNSADVVVGPIFHGEGMKTKTAEALMYGKQYLGTEEALCGYVGMDDCLCKDADDFISCINQLIQKRMPRYQEKARKLYEAYYSVEAANRILKAIIDQYVGKAL